MAAHGIPRYSLQGEQTEEGRQKELQKIEKYRQLDQSVREKIAEQQYTPETLEKIAELLTSNPEYYTVWNYRRQVLRNEFSRAASAGSNEAAAEQIATLIKNDLLFTVPLLRSFPKCYWIWNYRTWLLDEAKRLLPVPAARRFWQEELGLVGKMLTLDSRNFHGWGYRRFVVETLRELNSEEQEGPQMTQTEYEYAKKMIGANLSNFSAWHYRTKLIQRMLNEKSASDAERKAMLDDGTSSPLSFALPEDSVRVCVLTYHTGRIELDPSCLV
ncbi:hypothetical protein ASPBRDRAFT_43813 [Aspergillus brasiliensis CBS 101740]|uniref:Geranylgeranyl transferase type-2 subunit alpha n=1 Tax=Aspergillus brasiliensis (strain CBS 101740 / IMI 381727 / IBT 21946) TaxID=767769 RepID=A0A1L9UGY5_ASPBC|nr:hypothetical protein ASPBRDRAFT_43813 [Aspergillus brasiliensis CBS 101740]